MQPPERDTITCYGLDRSVESFVLRPESIEDVVEALDFARSRGLSVSPAGGRHSFGDVFLISDHVSLDLRGLDRIGSFDPGAGTLTVGGGTFVRDILARVMPLGWQLPALSGSLGNTVAGNLSSNIMGKDSWKLGSFGDQVESFTLVLADGSVRKVDRTTDAPLFAAVTGGLGLLGVIVEVTLRLQRMPSPRVEVRSRRVPGIAELLEHFDRLDPEADHFTYAWVDAFPGGKGFARGVCESARFVPSPEPISEDELRAQLVEPNRIFGLPPERFWGLVRGTWKALFALRLHETAFRTLNTLMYLRAGDRERCRTQLFPDYQYPMVKVFPHWNRKFAPEGFHEMHALLPVDRFETGLRRILAIAKRHRRTPEVVGVRRHRADGYPLSFAADGLSFTLPIALAGFGPGAVEHFEQEIVAEVLAAGGKIYLSKYPYLKRSEFRTMYPAAEEFLEVKARVDPDRLFWSEAAARLGLEA